MTDIDLAAGTISYTDSGGSGPTIVLLHGLLMDSSLWDGVIAALAPGYRCIAPTLPLGAHATPMEASADLSLAAIAALVVELLDRLDLHDVTLVGNDTGGALVQLVVAHGGPSPRIAAVVLVSCDAFDNLPPGLTGKTIVALGRLPQPLFTAAMQQLRLRPFRRLPIAFGWLTLRGDDATARWTRALLRNKDVRRDAVKVLRGIDRNRNALTEATARLARFAQPVLVVWAEHDRVMPPAHAARLAELFPLGRHVSVADTATLVPLDQPAALAGHIRQFVSGLDVRTSHARTAP